MRNRRIKLIFDSDQAGGGRWYYDDELILDNYETLRREYYGINGRQTAFICATAIEWMRTLGNKIPSWGSYASDKIPEDSKPVWSAV